MRNFKEIKHWLIAGMILSFGVLSQSCSEAKKSITIINHLNLDRTAETVSIPVADLKMGEVDSCGYIVLDALTNKPVVTQCVDLDSDGKVDELLFQTDIKANAQKEFFVELASQSKVKSPVSKVTTYSRFVPERIDDYTWENDRVAFRMYGPAAQQLVEAGKPGGTLGSGVDCWLKKVSYSIIDKWYKKNLEEVGYYHIEHGEGHDPYHVGGTRGCGGIGIWENSKLFVSKNYVSYKTIAEGPIRNIFELTYAPWDANGRTIKEKKTISIDLGSNLSRFESELICDKELPNCAIGITLHEKEGEVFVNEEKGWFRYWEPMDGSKLGLGIVIDPLSVQDYIDHREEEPDQSQMLVLTQPQNNKVVYYAGFGWKDSGQFSNVEEWDNYLDQFAQRIVSPLEVIVK